MSGRDFYEEDEPVDQLLAAYNTAGEQGKTATPEFPESTRAAIEANVKKWASRPIPDHIILRMREIWNSVE